MIVSFLMEYTSMNKVNILMKEPCLLGPGLWWISCGYHRGACAFENYVSNTGGT